MNKDNIILVTGGAGYIGSHTVVELVKAGYYPLIVDDFSNANRRVIDGLTQLIGFEPEIIEANVADPEALEPVFKNYAIRGIIHFAAFKAVGESVAEPLKYYRNNVGGLVTVLEMALKYKVNEFVFSSSCTVYGEPHEIKAVGETTPKSAPNSPYGHTKLIGEAILEDVQRVNPQLKVINLRYFNPIGADASGLIGEFPLGKPNNLLPYITQTAIGKLEKLTVFGNDYPTQDGTCIRDYIHVSDLANAHVKAIEFLEQANTPILEAVNVGTGNGTSVLEMIRLFEKTSNQTLNWQFGARRPGDVTEIFAQADKAATLLNWKATHSIEEAIRDAWNWEQKLHKHA